MSVVLIQSSSLLPAIQRLFLLPMTQETTPQAIEIEIWEIELPEEEPPEEQPPETEQPVPFGWDKV